MSRFFVILVATCLLALCFLLALFHDVSDVAADKFSPDRRSLSSNFTITDKGDAMQDALRPIGGVMQINEQPTIVLATPALSSLSSHNFGACYYYQAPDSSTSGIHCTIVKNSGSILKKEFEITAFGDSQCRRVSTASWAMGIAVIWQQCDTHHTDWSVDVFGQLLDNNGNKMGQVFQANTMSANTAIVPMVSSLSGYIVVTWSSSISSTTTGVFSQVFNEQGMPFGTTKRVLTCSIDGKLLLTQSSLNDGVVLVWTYSNNQTLGVWFQIYDEHMEALSGVTQVNDVSVPGTPTNPSVTQLVSGGMVVLYEMVITNCDMCWSIVGAVFDKTGNMVGRRLFVNSYDIPRYPLALALNDGGFLVSWSLDSINDGVSIGAFQFSGEGVKDGVGLENTRIDDQPASQAPVASIVGTPQGDAFAAWTVANGDIHAQKLHFGDTTMYPSIPPTPPPSEDRVGPTVVNPVGKQVVAVGEGFEISLQYVFQDVEGRKMSLQVTTCDGEPLPTWIDVHAANTETWQLICKTTPVANTTCITATVTDDYGEKVSDSFLLVIKQEDATLSTDVPMPTQPPSPAPDHGSGIINSGFFEDIHNKLNVVTFLSIVTLVSSVIGATMGCGSKVAAGAQMLWKSFKHHV